VLHEVAHKIGGRVRGGGSVCGPTGTNPVCAVVVEESLVLLSSQPESTVSILG
jgi:hypothetical protein